MIRQDWSSLKKLLFFQMAAGGGAAVERTATGNPLAFVTDLARQLKSLLIPFTPVQSGTGDPSPQNIRSIVPWNGLTVFGGGKNLFDETAIKTANSILSEYGGISGNANYDVSDFMFVKAGTYSISFDNYNAPSVNTVLRICCYSGKSTSDFIRQAYNGSPLAMDQRIEDTFTITSDCYILVTWRKTHTNIMLVVGSTPSAYEQYKPITETEIPFASPVYGGTLDVVSGVLTVEWVKYKLSDFTWSYVTTGGANAFRTSKLDSVMKASTSNVLLYCDTFNPVSAVTYYGKSANKPDLSIFQLNASDERRIMVKDEAHTDPADFRNTYGNVEICYALLTSQTVTLTPAQITALVGDNTIWSDADGQMTATYLKKG